MLSSLQFEAIDCDLTGNGIPFGRKIFVLGGDFRQTLFVVWRCSYTSITENFFTCGALLNVFRLTINMRANPRVQELKSFFYLTWVMATSLRKTLLLLLNPLKFHTTSSLPTIVLTTFSPKDQIFSKSCFINYTNHPLSYQKEATSINSTMSDRLLGEVHNISKCRQIDGSLDN